MPGRPRPLLLITGAFLALFALYSVFSLRLGAAVQVVTTHLPKPPQIISPPPPLYPAAPQTPAEDDFRQDAPPKIDPDRPPPDVHAGLPSSSSSAAAARKTSSQSIEKLIAKADEVWEEKLSRQTYSLEDAAAAYRTRRGRHPPPGFDRWYQYAMENNAIIVEDFWDQIYHDLNPFWAISPAMIRAQARALGMAVEIKDGVAKPTTDWFWHEIWGRMISEVSRYLPDMFIALNPMDESRLLVRWEQINEYMTIVNKEKKIVDPSQVKQMTKGWGLDTPEVQKIEVPEIVWNGFNPYAYARRACPPDSPARQFSSTLSAEKIMAERNSKHPTMDVSQYFDGGFVTNYTEASDFCTDAAVGGLHGALMQPLTCSNTDSLVPMFGGSKFHVNNEILLPAPMYWNGEERFGGDAHGDATEWSDKETSVLWRGTATGGRNKPFTWHLFHRHRYVAITNGTKYAHADPSSDLIFNPFFRASAIDDLKPNLQAQLGTWLNRLHQVGFTNLVCDENEDDGGCWYTNDEFEKMPGVEFLDQFAYKYLPDIDGNSFSGRYRAFLMSNSLPIKATIYREWHDSRLLAWKHFVPMNNRFSDYYRIMQYFIGSVGAGIADSDKQAQKLAIQGRTWTEKVLRKVDMQIYVLRLLLEYGRITDDERAISGWVEDIARGPKVGATAPQKKPAAADAAKAQTPNGRLKDHDHLRV